MYKKYKELERELLKARMDLKLEEAKLDKVVKLAGPPPYRSPQYDQPKVSSSMKAVDVNELYLHIIDLRKRVLALKSFVLKLEEIKDTLDAEIRDFSEKFNDLESKVFIMHHIERQSLHSISVELCYSYAWIKEINAKIIKKIKQPTKNLLIKNESVL